MPVPEEGERYVMSVGAIDWSAKQDMDVTVTGIAQNAKAGAMLMTGPAAVILVRGLSEWGDETVGKKVTVEAIVRRVRGYPKAKRIDGNLMQGTATGGDIWALELKRYHVLD